MQDNSPGHVAWAFKRRITRREEFAELVAAPVYLQCDGCPAPLPGRRPKHRFGFGFSASGELLLLDHPARKNLEKRDDEDRQTVGASGLVTDSQGATFQCGWHSEPLRVRLNSGVLLRLASAVKPPGATFKFSQARGRG